MCSQIATNTRGAEFECVNDVLLQYTRECYRFVLLTYTYVYREVHYTIIE